MIDYVCPNCGYDGSDYKNGGEGWVDAVSSHVMSMGACCGKCCCRVAYPFQCAKCRRWLAGIPIRDDMNRQLCGHCVNGGEEP